jgi:beta-galactosidase
VNPHPPGRYGFALYTTTVPAGIAAGSAALAFKQLKDRVQVIVDGAYVGSSYRVENSPPVTVNTHSGSTLQLLLENMGRINYGHGMDQETKGLGNVTLGGTTLSGWSFQCLPFEPEQVAAAPFAAATGQTTGPTLYRGTFTVDTPADTFLLMDGWTKGVAWINGFALGRYWQTKGPQLTLYLPGPKLVAGTNTLYILELENSSSNSVTQLVEQPMLQAPPGPPPSAKCDPGAVGTEGAAVRMVTETAK